MKTCKKCHKEFDENLTYCPFCGAENADRKLTYVERKQAREKDTEFILSKAEIQPKDIEQAKEFDVDKIYLEKVQEIKKAKTLSIVRMIIEIILFVGCILWGEITLKEDINANVKLAIVLVAFIAVAVAASMFISDIYTFMSIRKIENEEFLPKKIYFGKGPIVTYKDMLYEVKTNEGCPCCKSDMHIEEKEGDLYCVCNQDRSHIYKIDKNKYIEASKLKIEQK